MKLYIDTNDWWIGYYRGDTHHYVCPLPTLVIRWRMRSSLPASPLTVAGERPAVHRPHCVDHQTVRCAPGTGEDVSETRARLIVTIREADGQVTNVDRDIEWHRQSDDPASFEAAVRAAVLTASADVIRAVKAIHGEGPG